MSGNPSSSEPSSNELPESFLQQDQYGRDANMILRRLEEIAGDNPETPEILQNCREARARLIQTLASVSQAPLPMKRVTAGLSASAKWQMSMAQAKVLEEMVELWGDHFTPDQLEPIVTNMALHPHVRMMLDAKTHESLEDQTTALQAMIRARFNHIIFDGMFKEASERLFAYFPEDFSPMFRQEMIAQIEEEVASQPNLKVVFGRFCQLRTQVKALSSQVRPLSRHRVALHEKLLLQQLKGAKKSQRKKTALWAKKLTSAQEELIPDQIRLTEFEQKGMDFSWVIDPSRLEGDEKRLHMLDIVQATTLHAAGKLFMIIQGQLDGEAADRDFDDEEDGINPDRN